MPEPKATTEEIHAAIADPWPMPLDPAVLGARAKAFDLSNIQPMEEVPPAPTAQQLAEAALDAVHELAMRLGVPTAALAAEGAVAGSPGTLLHGQQQLQQALIQIQHYMQGNDARQNVVVQFLCRLYPHEARRLMEDIHSSGKVSVAQLQMEQTVRQANRQARRKAEREKGETDGL